MARAPQGLVSHSGVKRWSARKNSFTAPNSWL